MRTSQTFILRLLADPEEPGALHGVLHAVASGEEHRFAGGPALLSLLRRAAGRRPGSSDDPTNRAIDQRQKRSDQ